MSILKQPLIFVAKEHASAVIDKFVNDLTMQTQFIGYLLLVRTDIQLFVQLHEVYIYIYMYVCVFTLHNLHVLLQRLREYRGIVD